MTLLMQIPPIKSGLILEHRSSFGDIPLLMAQTIASK